MVNKKGYLLPIDRVSIALMLLLSVIILLVISQGNVVVARVRDFTWQHQLIQEKDISLTDSNLDTDKIKIGKDYTSFSMTFTRPMDVKSVEKNLKIEPPLAGKISWAGRRMVYTLLTPPPYGTNYELSLEGAHDRIGAKQGKKSEIKPFETSFQTRDRVILYIGAEKEEKGRLILYNLTREKKKVLTPKKLLVVDFEAFPDGDKILFSAIPSKSQDLLAAKIYTVTTGIPTVFGKKTEPAGKVNLIIDNKKYQNLKFDLSPDGNKIVIQRASRSDSSKFGLWFMDTNSDQKSLKEIEAPPGGDFIITPDSKAVAIAQGKGTAILPLSKDSTTPLDFFPQFGLVQAFSRDGSKAAMVKFNTDFTRDLFLVTNQGEEKQLLRTDGTILKCQFDTASPTLYCLLTQLLSGELYQEQPYLVAINLETGQQKPLLMLPVEQRNVEISLSPDGLGLLLDQTVPENTSTTSNENLIQTGTGSAIDTSSLWLMPLLPVSDANEPTTTKPQQLPLVGFYPRWLP